MARIVGACLGRCGSAGMARQCMARQGLASLGWNGSAGQARRGVAGKAWFGMSRSDRARPGRVGFGRRGTARLVKTWQGPAGKDEASPGLAWQAIFADRRVR